MSLNRKKELIDIAKKISRELRTKQTNAEKKFWDLVRDRQLLNRKFYRQYPIFYDVKGKETFFIADFYCYEKKLVIEVDGVIHKFKLKEDEERTRILNFLGLRVVRFNNEEIETNIEKIKNKLILELT